MVICWNARQKSWQTNSIFSQKKEGQTTAVRSSFLFVISAAEKQDFKVSLLEGGDICVSNCRRE